MMAARALAGGLWALVAGPPLVVLALICTFAVNIPFQDDWDAFAVVTNAALGTLSFTDFWAQHSEHRIPAVKILISVIGRLTDYDVIAEMLVGFTFAVVTLALVHRVLARSLEVDAPGLVWPLTAAASLLLFSLGFHEDWFWGLASLQLFLLDLMTVVVVWSLTARRRSRTRLTVATAAAIVGSLTHASGLLLWGTGVLGLAVPSDDERRGRADLVVWLAAAATVSVAYMWGLEWTSSATALSGERVAQALAFAGTSLGSPFAYGTTSVWSLLLGVSGIAMLTLGLEAIYQERPAALRRLMPVLLLGLHGLATVALIAWGRADGEAGYAMASHLMFGPTFFWITALVILAVAVSLARPPATARSVLLRRTSVTALTLLLTLGYVNTNAGAYDEAQAHSRNLSMALAALRSSAPLPSSVNTFLYSPDDARLNRQIAALKTARLGPFADRPASSRSVRIEVEGPSSGDERGVLDGGTCREIFGWAWDPQRPELPVDVELWRGSERLATVPANWFRTDLLKAGIGNGQHGFRYEFDTPLNLGSGVVVTARFAGSSRALRNSPQSIFCR